MAKPRRPKQRQKRDDPVLDRVIDDVLNGNVDVIPEFADLPRRWREAPEEVDAPIDVKEWCGIGLSSVGRRRPRERHSV